MTPEELDEFRKSIVKMRSSKSHMAHITADILDAAVVHIDLQAGQIDTLKAALQTAIAYEITCRVYRKPFNHLSENAKRAALLDAKNHIDEYLKEGAQLAQEIPDIFGDETE